MAGIYWYECRIEEAQRKIASLKDELDNLNSMKSEVSNGADITQGQIEKKRKTAKDLLMMESRLPLVRSLNDKVQENVDDTFRYNMLSKFDDADAEVNSAIHKVQEEIEEQNEIIRQCRSEIIRIQEEERREAERREAARRESERRESERNKI
ncbi:hypothetical protein [Clostridium sp. KNHs205]|uniref:hypothetical protein n=1 Tax=Clostridium sp. KNHs205 TaxID=1449050 RepID=UPI00051B1360|nr:hypothetical protein [Clostridium sp. KNHs205]